MLCASLLVCKWKWSLQRCRMNEHSTVKSYTMTRKNALRLLKFKNLVFLIVWWSQRGLMRCNQKVNLSQQLLVLLESLSCTDSTGHWRRAWAGVGLCPVCNNRQEKDNPARSQGRQPRDCWEGGKKHTQKYRQAFQGLGSCVDWRWDTRLQFDSRPCSAAIECHLHRLGMEAELVYHKGVATRHPCTAIACS